MNTVLVDSRPARISWGAVFAGGLISLIVYLVLSVLGTAIGASALDPMGDAHPLAGFGTGTGVWLTGTTLLAIFAGAYIAGRSAPSQGALHGVLTWAATTLATVWLLASLAAGLAGAAANTVGKGLSLAGQGAAAAAPQLASSVQAQLRENGIALDWDDLKRELDTALRQTGKAELDPQRLRQDAQRSADEAKGAAQQAALDPQAANAELSDWFAQVRERGEPALAAADKDALAHLIAARTGQSLDQARVTADRYAQTYDQAMAKYQQLKAQAEQKAREAAQTASAGVSKAAWSSLIVLILGGLLALFAGRLGYRRQLR
ncbi:YrzE family protein [Lysobacter enzymogenes]|uniref:YrzE family protein n=1 Tax=Lysobacter enzymogenes TaxID=69 RepID=UPI0038503516